MAKKIRSAAVVKPAPTMGSLGQRIDDYKQLVKFRLNLTVVFSAVMAFLITSTASVNWVGVVVLALAGFLVTGAANALNQVLEKDYDRQMERTANRPIAAGRMTTSEGVMAAGFMSLVGITLLALFNPLASLLGMISMILYAFVYTPMKRVSPAAVWIGALPGALPMLIGCVALEGRLSALALTLFGIQFLWQFPHFWAIGWLAHEDYTGAGFRLLPTTPSGERDPYVGLHAMVFSLALIPVGCLPYFLGWCDGRSAVALALLAVGFAWFGWNLYQKNTRAAALQLMFSSLFYLPSALFILLATKI
ncbi:MAG: heme o synthase [Bacteroidota bacterium]